MGQAAFDELIHAPLRLQICAMLAPVQSMGFSDIRDSLEISDSVLSKHLAALADAHYVEVSRVRENARSRRRVKLTKLGRTALRGHLEALRVIVAAAESATKTPAKAAGPKHTQTRVDANMCS
jgi:DNA-binding MarR family transcriptional regulator